MTPTVTSTSVTPTPTPTSTPCIECYEYSFGPASSSGLVVWRDCDGLTQDFFVNPGDSFTIDCSGGGVRKDTMLGPGPVVIGALCSTNCPTPTPTSTISITSTPTPTPTTTPVTPTPTKTPTQTPTPSQTGGLTPTPTSTSVTPTPTKTPTPTITPSTPVGGCLCYNLVNSTGTGGDYSYTQCGSSIPVTDSLGAFSSIQICSEDLPLADPNISITPCGDPCSTNDDCTGCS